jgi:hypothetical protein
MKCRVDGYEEFKLFAKNTVYLESIKHVNEDQEQLRRILATRTKRPRNK